MSDTGNSDPNDPYRAKPEGEDGPPPPPQAPRWGSNPPEQPSAPEERGSAGGWTGGQLGSYGQQPDQPQYGQPQYGQPQYGQPEYGQPQGQPWQPQYGQADGAPPPDHLVWAILTTLFCCSPLGIPSIVYAARVNALYAGGDVAAATESSRKAKQFAIWSALTMVIVYGLFIFLAILGAVADSS